MSGTAPARVIEITEGKMTVAEARSVLRHPVFGDERCIEAHKILELAAYLREARKAHGIGEDSSVGEDFLAIKSMDEAELRHELVCWRMRGWKDEEDDA